MNSARKLPRLNSEPGGYDKDYVGHKYSSSARDNSRGYGGRRSSSPDRDGDRGGGGGRDLYNKYNNHRQDSREYKYGRAKDIRDSDRERDRSPRDRKNWDYKGKIRDKDESDGRGGGGHLSHNSHNFTSYGDWSEQISSSGKKYYYNSNTEVSQWEKPREWADAERARQPSMDKSRDWGDHDKMRSNSVKLHCDRNNRSSQDKHGLDHRSSPVSSSSLSSSRHRDRLGSNRSNNSSLSLHNNSYNNHHNNHDNNSSNHHHHNSRDRDHPRDSLGYGNNSHVSRETREWDTCRDRGVSECSTGDATPTSEGEGDCGGVAELNSSHHHPGGAVSLSAAISRISQPQVGLSVSTGGGQLSRHSGHSNQPSPLQGVSPPTPTHDSSLHSPGSALVSRLPSLQHVSSLAGTCQAPIQLTPSLSRLYKEQLIGHVLAWPAEHVERGINKVGEDANQISNHHITKVSADLKMARSLVRLAEIQATLQEQRILFLRQQMTDLEKHDTSWVARGTCHASTPTREHVSSSSSSSYHHRDSNDSRDSESASSDPGSLHQERHQERHHEAPQLSLTQPSSVHVGGNSVNYSNV